MNAFISALIPVMAIVALGRFLGWRKVLPDDGWRAIERLAYIVLFPALIIRALANAPFETAPWKLALILTHFVIRGGNSRHLLVKTVVTVL